KQLQPAHVLIYLVLILLMLTGLSFLVKGENIQFLGMNVRFLTLNDALTPTKPIEKKDISKVIAIDTVGIDVEIQDTTVKNTFKSDGKMGAPTGGTLSAEASTSLQFNETGKLALH